MGDTCCEADDDEVWMNDGGYTWTLECNKDAAGQQYALSGAGCIATLVAVSVSGIVVPGDLRVVAIHGKNSIVGQQPEGGRGIDVTDDHSRRRHIKTP